MSCGLADCVASSMGGRNRKCSEEYATWLLNDNLEDTMGDKAPIIKKTWAKIEARLLNGQKMQGVLTCEEVIECLIFKNMDKDLISTAVKRPRESYMEYKSRREGLSDPFFLSTRPYIHTGMNGVASGIKKYPEYKFGLFKRIYAIAHDGDNPETLFDW